MNGRVSCFLTTAFALMVIASTNPSAAVAQFNPPTETSARGNRISINVVVTDKNGQAIRELQPGDFTVFDNDEPQRLLAFRTRAVGDGNASYLITFKAARADRSDEFHEIAVRVDRPNLNVRTIRGYYPHPRF